MAIIITALIISAVASGILCAIVADEKHRSAAAWGLAGFFFPLFALIAVAGLPASNPQNIRECTFCRQFISIKANICPYCQNELEPVLYCSVEYCWIQYLEPTDAVLLPCLDENCDEEHAFCKVHARERA